MKNVKTNIKKIFALVMCAALIAVMFAGCSSAGEAEEITDETMLVAYTDENKPFLYTNKNGNLTGLDVEIFKKVFDDVKNEYEDYEFVKVDEDYKVGEDVAYTDKDGNEYTAYVMIGGQQKNIDAVNEENSFTADIISDRIITVTTSSTGISTYADLASKKAGVVTTQAADVLDSNSAIKSSLKSVKQYDNIDTALSDLDAGKIDVVVTDEFTFNVLDNKDNYVQLDGELDTIEYGFKFNKSDSLVESFNEAIYELKSPEYNDADELTPIVEKYFGYNASSFDYEPSDTKD